MKFKLITKTLSIVTAAAIIATSVPMSDVSAAVKPKRIKVVNTKGRKKSRHTLALGEIKSIKSTGRATANVRFSPSKSSKGLRVSSDDTSVVKVRKKNSSGTSWTMEGMGAGNANISIRSAVISSLKYNFKAFVTSRPPEELELSKSSLTMNVNQGATIEAMNKKATVNVTFDNTKVDRFITVKSSDDKIVSVIKNNDKKYTVRALKAGTATLTVASATDSDVAENITVTVKATEPETGNFSVKQTKKNQIFVTLPTAQTVAPSLSAFKLRQKNAIWEIALSKITLGADGKSVYIDTMIDLMKDTDYELTYAPIGTTQSMKAEFKTSTSKPTRIELKTKTVVANMPKKLSYALYDSNGVELIDVDDKRIDVTVNTRNGYYDQYNKTLTMFMAGETADVKIIYHTYEYQNGVEQVITGAGKIMTLSTSNISLNLEKFIVKRGEGKLTDAQWTSSSIPMVPVDAKDAYLAVKIRSSDNEYYTSDNALSGITFNFESKNPDILSIDKNTGKISVNNFTPGKNAVIVITATYEGKSFSYTVTLNTVTKSIPYRVELSTQPVQIKRGETKEISLKVFDQYNLDISDQGASGIIGFAQVPNSSISTTINGIFEYRNDKKLYLKLTSSGSITTTAGIPCNITVPEQNNRTISGFTVIAIP